MIRMTLLNVRIIKWKRIIKIDVQIRPIPHNPKAFSSHSQLCKAGDPFDEHTKHNPAKLASFPKSRTDNINDSKPL